LKICHPEPPLAKDLPKMVRMWFSAAWLFTRIVAEKPINCMKPDRSAGGPSQKRLRMTDLESFVGSRDQTTDLESFVGSRDQMTDLESFVRSRD